MVEAKGKEEAVIGLIADAPEVSEPKHAQAHAWAIAHLLKNPDEAAAMGRRGRQAVEQCWNWDIEAEKIVRFYREIFCEREVDHAL
jgi:glycosyltransferase involved in cell wall biosynthesis